MEWDSVIIGCVEQQETGEIYSICVIGVGDVQSGRCHRASDSRSSRRALLNLGETVLGRLGRKSGLKLRQPSTRPCSQKALLPR